VNKHIPVWAFLLTLLLAALFTMVFGWSIESTVNGSDRSGRFGKAAVMIASYPVLVKSVLTDVWVDVIDTDEPIRIPRTTVNLSEFAPINSRPGIDVQGLMMRADITHNQLIPGWRILVGAFTINDEVKNAALALSPELEITNVWILTEDTINEKEPRPPHRKFIHGFDILNDGSVIFSFDGGVSLQRFDRCSERVWAIAGSFHHAVTLNDSQEFVWTLRNYDEAVKVVTANGEIARHFSMDDIITANPTIDIFQIRKRDDNDLGGNGRNTTEDWLQDHFHLNDVDPLPVALADHFDGFEAGDLLMSARSLNLVFVVDPNTLEIKWWRFGATRRQHDPDWGWNGEINVYDKRMSRDYSRIVSISPTSFQTKVLFDGRNNDFYSRIRGKQQLTENGNLIITSTQQGRVFEINPDGDVVLEFINTKPGSDESNFVISQAIWLPHNTFNFGDDKLCIS
jgi:hypothetical protein